MTTAEDQASIDTIKRLSSALAVRAPEMERYDAYFKGEQGKRLTGKTWQVLFSKRFEGFAENFMGLVVNAVADRLEVQGFRLPKGKGVAVTGDEQADTDAWRIWQDNKLDAKSQIAHTESLVKGLAYVLVSPMRDDFIGDSPRITIEDALQTIVETRPGTEERLAGMKRWYDDIAKRTYVTLYFPDRIEKWQSGVRQWANQHGSGVRETPDAWDRRTVEGEEWPLPNPLGVVPIVAFPNRPGLNGTFESEIKQVIPIQDAINTLAINELVASETASFKQKWATGIEIPMDPDTGKPTKDWQPDIQRILSTTNEDAKFGNFEGSDITQYGSSIDRHVQRLASISQTPYHYFLQHSGQPPSGESLKSSEVPLVRKCRARQRPLGEAWEEVERLAFAVLKDPRADVTNSETIWANPESMTEAEHIDALTKSRVSLKVPLKQLWSDAGYTPAQIQSFEGMLAAEAAMLRGTLVAPVEPDGANVQEQVQERVSA